MTLLAPVLMLGAGPVAAAKTYRVAPGDTLFLIAQRHGTTVEYLMRQNGLSDATIYPGQTLELGKNSRAGDSSPGGAHLVRPGESLYIIARRYGVSVEALKAANGLSGNYIEAGQRLVIPSGGGAGGNGYHTVQPGETLYLVATRYGTTVEALKYANGLQSNVIYAGQQLRLPSGSGQSGTGWQYTVRPGDTLYLLAARYGTTVDALRRANGLATNTLYVGQVIRIPAGSGGGTNPASPSESDLELLARLVSAEAAGEPYAGQVAVAATILNRLNDPKYPKTIPDIIYQYADGAYQYSPVMDGRIDQPATASAIAAVRDALNGWDPSYGATGFYNPSKTDNPWVRAQPVTTSIGNHVFFRY